MSKIYKLVIGVPEKDADAVRAAIAEAGAGHIGNYSHCSFSVKGIGRFKPLEGSHPAIGQIGKIEEVAEEQIQTVCEEEKLTAVLQALKQAHPYEMPAVDVFPLESIGFFDQS